MKKRSYTIGVLIACSTLATANASAQSSVTLYGIVDTGIGYQSSSTTLGSTSNGHSAVRMIQGVWDGSRVGFKGSEDLGGGNKAVFVIEEGFNSATGAMSVSGLAFNRQAFVGLANATYGSFTLGRQYATYYQILSSYSPTNWLSGYYGAHPGDLDGLDIDWRANNTIEYMSPNLSGFKFGGSYSIGGVPGSFNSGSTWTVAMQYAQGPIGIAAGFSRINNSTPGGGPFGADSTTSNAGAEVAVSAVTNGYQTAQTQQRFTVEATYIFSQFDVTGTYSNVQYLPGSQSLFRDSAIFNTGGVVLHWKPGPWLDLAAGYSYTRATTANGIESSARYQQFNLSEFYTLSKRTSIYVLQGYQRAGGQTLGTDGHTIIDATATLGDGFQSTPSSSRSMFAVGTGIVHQFQAESSVPKSSNQ